MHGEGAWPPVAAERAAERMIGHRGMARDRWQEERGRNGRRRLPKRKRQQRKYAQDGRHRLTRRSQAAGEARRMRACRLRRACETRPRCPGSGPAMPSRRPVARRACPRGLRSGGGKATRGCSHMSARGESASENSITYFVRHQQYNASIPLPPLCISHHHVPRAPPQLSRPTFHSSRLLPIASV